MNSAQSSAFENGAGVLAVDLTIVIAGVVAVLMLLWLCWIALAHLKLWHGGRILGYDLVWNLIRAIVLTLLLGFFIR